MSIADDIVSLIRAHRFDLSSEDALQQGLAQVLSGSSFKHQREVALTKADRIDFQCAGRLHRDGQSEPVVAYYLMADSGSDPIVADVLGVKATQAKGIRDPNAPLVQAMGHDGQHAKRLAQAYLERTTRRSRDKQEDSAA